MAGLTGADLVPRKPVIVTDNGLAKASINSHPPGSEGQHSLASSPPVAAARARISSFALIKSRAGVNATMRCMYPAVVAAMIRDSAAGAVFPSGSD